MSEEIKERLEKLRREYRPSMAGDVCLSWAADVAPALSEALALITSLTAELTAAKAESERLRGAVARAEKLAVNTARILRVKPTDRVAMRVTLEALDDCATEFKAALTPAEEGPRIVEGARMPYFCPACQAIPKHGYCNLPGCLTRPAEEGERG